MKVELIGGPRDGEEVETIGVRYFEFPIGKFVWREYGNGERCLGLARGVYERVGPTEYEWRGER